ncbi:MAG TPA: MmgE/PrpD family protein [Beijerinckiaceae bacterium]|nr:MmgE/PrpD family protein [Beijerinckiaceae bacterium]
MAKTTSSAPGSIKALARWFGATATDAIPADAMEQAKLILLDTIGCGLAGVNEEVSHAVLAMLADFGGHERCTIIGRPRKVNMLDAVLANGCLVRVLDLNDYIGGSAEGGGPEIGGHPSDNVPVALAVGEWQKGSGAEILASIVLGYEVFGRLKSLMDPIGTWDEVTISGLVAPAMAARLLRLDETQFAHALALGAARAATPAIVRGGHISAAKSIANALVAQSGVQGALLAAHGATGPLGVLDAGRSLHELFTKGDVAAVLSEPLPQQPYILRSNVKMYPCLATGQSAVAAALKLRAMVGSHERLQRIDVAMADYPIVRRQQQDPARIRPQSREAADHSFNFLVAVSLIDGAFGLPQYENERWRDPEVVELMERLTMTTDPSWSARAPGSYPCALRARDVEGKEYLAEIPYPPGFAHGRLDTATVIDKFNALAHDYLPAPARENVIAAALDLDKAPSIASLMEPLRPER